jgi:cytochrome P450
MALQTAAACETTKMAARVAPGPRYRLPFGFFVEARPDPLGYLRRVAHQFGDVVRVDAWPVRFHLAFHPDHIKYVLQENNRNYWKGDLIGKAKALIGDGLFTSEGDFWRRQRRIAQPSFHRERIARFAAIMAEATGRMLDRWHARAQPQQPMDIMPELSALTLSVVGRALFGIDLTGEAADVGQAMLEALEFLTHRTMHLIDLPLTIPTPRNRRFRRARRDLDRVVFAIIAQRRSTGGAGEDLLSMLVEARDPESGEGMSDQQLRDEVMTFVLAGHETTAVTLAWVFHLLAQHPQEADELRDEAARVLGGRAPVLADLPHLVYTRRVVEETLRLYPPVPVVSRQSFQADQIGGYDIPANSGVMVSPYVTHRDPRFWDEPERFDPDRFAPERCTDRPRFAYLPFGGGPRLCIGNEFAMMEAQIILALVMQRFRLEAVPGHRVEPEVRVTLRPRNGVKMFLQAA